MRSLLLLVLLLTGLAGAEQGKTLFEVVEGTYLTAARKAFEYGNYRASNRLLGELIKFYQGLHDHPKVRAKPELQPHVRANILHLQAYRVFALWKCRLYSDAISLGGVIWDNPEAAAEDRLTAGMGVILAAREAERPETVKPLLEPMLQLAAAQQSPYSQFALETFGLEQRLAREEVADAEVMQALEGAWKHLKGVKPRRGQGEIQTDALVFFAAERYWDRLLLGMVLATEDPVWQTRYTAEVDREFRVAEAAEATAGIAWGLPLFESWLDSIVESYSAGYFAHARKLLAESEEEFLQPYFARISKQETAHRKECARTVDYLRSLAPQIRKDGMPVPDARALDYSLVQGAVSEIRAGQLHARGRLLLHEGEARGRRMSDKEIQAVVRLLTAARDLQQRASQGTFLGDDDVRWALLGAGLADQNLAREMLLESEANGYRPGMVAAYSHQAYQLARTGLKAEAVEKLLKLVALLETHLAETGAGPREKEAIRDRYRADYELLARLQLELGQVNDAYSTLGRRQQVQSIASAGEVSPAAATLRGQAAALEKEVAAGRAAGQDTKAAEALLGRTRGEYNTVIARLRQENPRYASLLAIRPVSFSKQQQFIPNDTAIVQYFPAGESLYIFVATREELKIRQVAVTDAALEEAVRQFRKELLAKQPGGERLHQLLLDPVEADIASKPVVAFIPTGMLSYVPFGALSKNGKYLVSRKQCVTLLKSADLDGLSQPANRRRDGLLALGNPDGSLPSAGREATDVAALFGTTALLGKEASADKLAGAGKVAYLHLATHGFLNARNPAASYVQLASGPLPVEGIYDLKLDGVRLVTLSACQTALGEVNPGSELTTLADAFSLAGASAVVASLWSVDDQATQQLMTEFYRRLKAGENLAQALQGAQVKLLAAGQPPFFWAPFVLIGDWR